jgi:predicted nucleic acid-binding protein
MVRFRFINLQDRHRIWHLARELLTSLTIGNVLNTRIALKSADCFRSLRKRGITVRKTIDVIIATYCLESDPFLLHSDKDFNAFEQYLGLRVVH